MDEMVNSGTLYKAIINDKQRSALLRVLNIIDDLKSKESGYVQTAEYKAYSAAYDCIHALYSELSKCENGLYVKTLPESPKPWMMTAENLFWRG